VLVGVAFLAVLLASLLPASGSAGQVRDVRAWLSFDYKGNTVQHAANDLGFLQTASGSGGYGDEIVQDNWDIGYKVRVVIEDAGTNDPQLTGLVGRPIITSIDGGGFVDKYPTAKCPFGKLCPKPGSPTYKAHCSTNLAMNDDFFTDPGNSGYPDDSILPRPLSTLVLVFRIPSNAAGLKSGNPKCRSQPTNLTELGLDAFTPPIQFGDGPRPYTDPTKLAEYNDATAPTLKIEAQHVAGGTTVRVVGKASFDVNWDWHARQAKRQIGADVDESIDVESEFTNFKLTS
jgi:hypothetical protein